MTVDELIYLDAAAASPLSPEARQMMLTVIDGPVGNPGAAHQAGRRAQSFINEARARVGGLMRVGAGAVTFTAGATEANNLALQGLFSSSSRPGLVTCATEHPSVLATLAALTKVGADVHVVPVDHAGMPDLGALREAIGPSTRLVSVHAANNETGVMPDLAPIAELAHAAGAFMHSDASQLMAWGDSSPVDVCDLVTVSSHKMYGPQGAAALIASKRVQRQLTPILAGGGQEQGLRSGTPNTAALAGFGAAAELARASGQAAAAQAVVLRERLLLGLRGAGVPLRDHASGRRLPSILNLGLPVGVDGEMVLAATPQVAASTGSACHVGTPEPSPVLRAMGLSDDEASATLRLSLSRYTTQANVDGAVAALTATLRRLCAPLGRDLQINQEESFSA